MVSLSATERFDPRPLVERLSFGLSRAKAPAILQTEAAECGLACLAMVAGAHGRLVDLATLRRRFSTSLGGVTLKQLIAIAGRMEFSARALRVEMEALPELATPCVLHWGFNHFVVLEQVGQRTATVCDPAIGRRTLSHEELSKNFTGVALELTPTKEFAPADERQTIRILDLFRNVAGLPRAIVQLLALSLAFEVFTLAVPFGTQIIIDQAIVASDADLVTLVALGLALLVLLQTVIWAARAWGIMALSNALNVQWASALFGHLIRLPLDYFEKRHVGDVTSRFRSLETVQDTLSTTSVLSVVDGVMAVGLIVMMALFGGWLAAVAVATTLIYVAIRVGAYGPYRQASEETIVQQARENTHFLETLRGATTVKLFGLEDRRTATWLNLLVDRFNAKLHTQKLDVLFQSATKLLFGLDRVLILYLGANAVIDRSVTLGMLVAFLAYKDQFSTRVESLVSAGFKMRMLNLQAERLADIALSRREIAAAQIEAPSSGEPVGIELKNVTFSYGGEQAIVRDFDLSVAPGECVALLGPSGCGKTTLLKMLSGLLLPTSGAIEVEGALLGESSLAAFRQRIGCVLQDDRLFAGSIAENIACFDPHFDLAWARRCAAAAGIDQDVVRMPMGYETLVGDMGSTLSGGQKQRIFIARALYRRPQLFLLDEPTNHLDERAIDVVLAALKALPMTRIVVTHNSRVASIADRQILMTLPQAAARN
ncbi:peptidase domain-containing ABC transporter [Hansschlegelia zhihuaiae]|uniref:Peptidase domain-containing ABC transporter n=1 Tax=Hansschlegelia zhihuaiae TaxID=405005 RepID=A0A4Q0MK86_9HYPH|nr:peptidase domain-containing ABC transporter [Hansschlegelia zhihuaiae]RXF74161.1 peptidase domain-containing ABC transporter [Hansschlegelia zhihuaiae]